MSGKSLWVTEVTKDAPPKPLVKTIANTDGHGFATISPDDATVIAACRRQDVDGRPRDGQPSART